MIVGAGLTRDGIVTDASLTVAPGEMVVLLGPNGAGKTTLLRMLLGLAAADRGEATVDGVAVSALSPARRARRVAYLPQSRPLAWPSRVVDIVALGRFAHGAAPYRLGGQDAAAVAASMAAAETAHLATRSAHTLSGGELARVHLARALASRAGYIVADEPVASLDPRHQHRVLGLLADFAKAGGGVLAVLHDLDLAARYADRLVWIDRGRIVADGSVADTMTAERIAAIYGVAAHVERSGSRLSVIIDGAIA
ncbi:ABC transporter ATP-binding protein [Sphingomonas donggukensis]|uniref:ABC transporter ATP-binding protein n=1 Tax=Sphingomonas donggukensis TaxID=2949093 RepID=A0ABY4TXH3_9SPHN|nr:ABC transporter ATP-binding protein [Sphingomonas donggukensis]URW76689.1 ABC transporter ATP-binding protein [Sphingomonas donggukensis]